MRNLRRRALGFTLLESLIALLIGGFGLLAVARLQIGMQGESDRSRQLTEATFLGQRRIEMLRAYQQVGAADAAGLTAGRWGYDNILTGTETVNGTNATYAVSWTITQASASATYATVAPLVPVQFKTAQVQVAWTDRNGAARTANLSTVIAEADPATSLALTVPPAGTPIRRPKNRDLNVPVPAIDLGDGTSAFTPPGAAATVRLVFDNITGIITKVCDGTGTDISAWTCTNLNAYLVSGFIAENSSNITLSSPINLTMTLTEGALYSCYDDSATAKSYANYISYTCVVIGVDHDSDPGTRPRWSGRLDVTGIPIGTTSAENRVCRYSADYDLDGQIRNYEHPAVYQDVSESLENQNFYIVHGNTSCPSGTGIYAMVQHQP